MNRICRYLTTTVTEKSNKHHVFMKLALRHAQAAYKDKEIPIGSVVVRNEEIISAERNQVESQQNEEAQAEVLAISSALSTLKSDSLPSAYLYTTLEPNRMIVEFALKYKIQGIVYGAEDTLQGAFSGSGLTKEVLDFSKLDIHKGILAEDSKTLLNSFFVARKKESPEKKLLSYRGDMNNNQ